MRKLIGQIIKDAQSGFASGERDDHGIIQLRMNNVDTRGNVDFSDHIRVPATEVQIERYSLQKSDIVFNNTNSTELVGKAALFRNFEEPVVFSNHFTRLRVKADEVDPGYLCFFINHLWLRKVFEGICQRWIGQSSVKFDKLSALPIPLPDLPAQCRITTRLKAQFAEIDAAREAAQAAKVDAEKMLDHYLRVAFQHIVPLSANPVNPVTPRGWRWAPLMELARLESGHTPSRRHPEYWENGDIPWLALPDIRKLDCQVVDATSERTNSLGIANSSARILPKNTVALSRTASVGFVTIFGREMCTSQDFVNWVCGEQILPRFLMWLLRASRNYIGEVSTGAIHKTVYMDVVRNFHVCLPPLEAQQQIVTKLDAVQTDLKKLSRCQAAQLDALNKLPAAYLREAFS